MCFLAIGFSPNGFSDTINYFILFFLRSPLGFLHFLLDQKTKQKNHDLVFQRPKIALPPNAEELASHISIRGSNSSSVLTVASSFGSPPRKTYVGPLPFYWIHVLIRMVNWLLPYALCPKRIRFRLHIIICCPVPECHVVA